MKNDRLGSAWLGLKRRAHRIQIDQWLRADCGGNAAKSFEKKLERTLAGREGIDSSDMGPAGNFPNPLDQRE
jgi:hypothetical protein